LQIGSLRVLGLSLCLLLSGCGGGSSNSSPNAPSSPTTPPAPPNTSNQWAWISGSSGTANGNGVYGTLGVPSPTNVPGARDSATSWIDTSGNLWLFGGEGIPAGSLNDLWKFDPSTKNWTWVSGSSTGYAIGVYGSIGVATGTNMPGSRDGAVSWIDNSGNLWLFGGYGYDSVGPGGDLNDLWKFNPSTKTWTWISGSNTYLAPGVYGTLGVASASNTPGARSFAVAWTDRNGNLWLFGGAGENVLLNDVWEFSPSTSMWTWMGGSTGGEVAPVYGTLNVASTGNTPGGRDSSSVWVDSNGNFWLFGGLGEDPIGLYVLFNDLWEFSPTAKTWTWVSGSNTGNAPGTYGTQGTPSSGDAPGARSGAASWIDTSGNLWLFGGSGLDSTGQNGGLPTSLNDLWEFSPSAKTWTWVDGSNLINATGVYGTLGTPSTSNVPGSRYSAVGWTDSSGNFWLFGGQTGLGDLNDLWEYQP
jgi:N-acetylneuraminic acid mutarotase